TETQPGDEPPDIAIAIIRHGNDPPKVLRGTDTNIRSKCGQVSALVARTRPQFPCRPDLCGQLFQESHDRFDTTIEICDVKFLIRRMQVVIWKSEAHHHARDLKMLLELGH